MHKPVLLNEVFEIFDPRPGQTYIDATINGGGHALAILEKVGPRGKVLGIDWDKELIKILEEKKKEQKITNLFLECGNYVHLQQIARKRNIKKANGILFDLGFSSYHISESRRGFSFRKNEPLDMRYNLKENELTAEKIINQWTEQAIADVIYNFGEDRFARHIARAVLKYRERKKIASTVELRQIIERAISGSRGLTARIHPATRTFQALRIAVNNELENLRLGLEAAAKILPPRGKIIAISFHSLEDRIVKNFFKGKSKEKILNLITPKPVIPSFQEIKENPRARSAKLRVAEAI